MRGMFNKFAQAALVIGAAVASTGVAFAQAEAQTKSDDADKKDAELSGLKAKVSALTDERDQLEEQVNTRLANAENEREELRGQLETARADSQRLKGDLDRAKQHEERLKMDVDRAKVDAGDERKAKVAAEAKVKELTDAAKVEKWFKRNCTDTLGRLCTSAEKADLISFLLSAQGGT